MQEIQVDSDIRRNLGALEYAPRSAGALYSPPGIVDFQSPFKDY
jgi:hypothetical protein